ncbi:MAG: hypothetical protein U9Q66_02275 [Patescibacteria group bacterium]|nr:hypothetical protein [Patescibacteria group bacterium]
MVDAIKKSNIELISNIVKYNPDFEIELEDKDTPFIKSIRV